MVLGESGSALIKSYEKLRLNAYLPTPDDVWTIGWGHTKGVNEGDVCTEEQAQEWFREDTQWAVDCINDNVREPMTQNEFDALVSLVFNIGCPAFRASTLLKYLNLGNFEAAIAEFRKWNKQAGRELAGLTNRREKEAELFQA